MQVSAEINLGSRTALQCLLSPIEKTMYMPGASSDQGKPCERQPRLQGISATCFKKAD